MLIIIANNPSIANWKIVAATVIKITNHQAAVPHKIFIVEIFCYQERRTEREENISSSNMSWDGIYMWKAVQGKKHEKNIMAS